MLTDEKAVTAFIFFARFMIHAVFSLHTKCLHIIRNGLSDLVSQTTAASKQYAGQQRHMPWQANTTSALEPAKKKQVSQCTTGKSPPGNSSAFSWKGQICPYQLSQGLRHCVEPVRHDSMGGSKGFVPASSMAFRCTNVWTLPNYGPAL